MSVNTEILLDKYKVDKEKPYYCRIYIQRIN